MSFEEMVSSESRGADVLGGVGLVCGGTEPGGSLASGDASEIGVQFGDPCSARDLRPASQREESSDVGEAGALSESFLVSISELRYVVLVCIRWRLQNSVELASEVPGGVPGLAADPCPPCEDSAAPSRDLLVSYLLLYRSCVSESHKEELEMQVVRDILKLIDPSVGIVGDYLTERLDATARKFVKDLIGGGGAELLETSEMRDAENSLASQFLLGRLPFPDYAVFLGKETTESTIGDIISSTEHPSGLNLANVASTPSVLGALLKHFDISWPSHIFESLLFQSEAVGDESQQQDPFSGARDAGDVSLSLGSLTHVLGLCKPCVFVNKTNKKCRNGVLCCFCHFQHKERKRGKRYKSSSGSSTNCGFLSVSSGLGGLDGSGMSAGGAPMFGMEGLRRPELPLGLEDSLRAPSISAPSHVVFGSANSGQFQGSVQSAGTMGIASGSQGFPDVLFARYDGLQQAHRYPSRTYNGSSVPLAAFQPLVRGGGSVLGKSSKPSPAGMEQQQQPVRYLVPPPPPPPSPSKTVGLQIFRNEKDAGLRSDLSLNLNSVATSTSAEFHQFGTAYLEKSSASVGVPRLLLESCQLQGSLGTLPSLHDPFFEDFNGYNKLINEAPEMNNWISANSSENLSNAINLSSRGRSYLQWLDQTELGESSIPKTWRAAVAPFEAFTKGNSSVIPQNLNQCLNDSGSLSKAATHQDWALASSVAKDSSASQTPNKGIPEPFSAGHDNTSNKNSGLSAQPASQKPKESFCPKTGLHLQDQTLAATLTGDGEKPSTDHGGGCGDYLLGSLDMFASSLAAFSALSDYFSADSDSFAMPGEGIVPPFLRIGHRATGGTSSEYPSSCSPASSFAAKGSEGAETKATGFGAEFCFVNPWK